MQTVSLSNLSAGSVPCNLERIDSDCHGVNTFLWEIRQEGRLYIAELTSHLETSSAFDDIKKELKPVSASSTSITRLKDSIRSTHMWGSCSLVDKTKLEDKEYGGVLNVMLAAKDALDNEEFSKFQGDVFGDQS